MTKLKFHWGTGIFLFIGLFFIAAVSFVIWTTTQDISLVEKDYYPRGVKFDEQRQKIANTGALPEKITANVSKEHILLQFPKISGLAHASGTIWVYRPSDETKDLRIPVKPDTSGVQLIPRSRLIVGKYLLKIDWQADSIPYYQEFDLYLP